MSIILKGIDLPNSGQIEIIIRPHGKVLSKTRGISAEAIQIPKGHGRIVDLDDLVVKYWDGNYMTIDNEAYDNAVAILEAEE